MVCPAGAMNVYRGVLMCLTRARAWVAPGILLPVLISRLRLCLPDVLLEFFFCFRFIVAPMYLNAGSFSLACSRCFDSHGFAGREATRK